MKNLFVLLTLFVSSQATSQITPSDTAALTRLDEVVVSATRSKVSRRNTPQNITLINSKDINRTFYQDFTDIVKKNSSVNVIQYPSLLSGVGIRGFRPQTGGLNQRALLLVDGRPAGTSNISTINPSGIERIEILKGPASALYGSNAMGGVVNIITVKSRGEIRGGIAAEYGSFQTSRLSAYSGGNITSRLDFDISFTSFDRNKNMRLGKDNILRNWMKADKAVHNYTGSSEYVDDTRGDGLRREFTRLRYNTGSLRLGYEFTSGIRLDVRAEKFFAKNVESPSDVTFLNADPSTKDIDKNNIDAIFSAKINNHHLSLRGYFSDESGSSYTIRWDGKPIIPYLSLQNQAMWNGLQVKDVFEIKQHAIIFGVDHNTTSTTSRAFSDVDVERAPYSPNYSFSSTAAYIQGQFNFMQGKMIINPGARYDIISYNVKQTPLLNSYAPGKETNPFFSPNVSAQYSITENIIFHGTIGRAFVNPDAYNVAGYSEVVTDNKASVTQGNPELKNESSLSWDAGIRFHKKEYGLYADVTYFSTRVNDRITTQRSVPAGGVLSRNGNEITALNTYVNANYANINGLEGELNFDPGYFNGKKYSINFFVNATKFLYAKEVSVSGTGSEIRKDIYNIPGFTSSYGVDYSSSTGWNVRLNSRYVGKRKDTNFNDPLFPEIVYPNFMVVDIVTSYTYKNKHTLGLYINNVTDENYYEKRGYNLQGRSFTLKYAIKL